MTSHSHFRLKKIVVPVDFSEQSWKAVHYAISLAKPFNAELSLLHVVEAVLLPPDVEVVELATLATTLNEEAAKLLSEWRRKVASQIPVKKDLRAGTPYREIVDAALEGHADLIVMGTRGRSGLTRLLVGSTAERVVRLAPCPVLLVREFRSGHDTNSEKGAFPKAVRQTSPRNSTRRLVSSS